MPKEGQKERRNEMWSVHTLSQSLSQRVPTIQTQVFSLRAFSLFDVCVHNNCGQISVRRKASGNV